MADIPVKRPTEVLALAAFTASTPAGDALSAVQADRDLIVEVRNGHGSAVTVTLAPLVTAVRGADVGNATKTGLSASVPAGQDWMGFIPASLIRLYIDPTGKIPIAYTGGNAALLVRGAQPA